MPNGQNRYANKAQQRSPRRGRTIRVGKKLGVASVEGRYADIVRELEHYLPFLSMQEWKRLGKWVVALGQEQGITPASNDGSADTKLANAIREYIETSGWLPTGKSDWQPRALKAKPLSSQQERERQINIYFERKKHAEFCGEQYELNKDSTHEEVAPILQYFKEEIEEWERQQSHWDKFWDYYGQCEESKHGQRLSEMSPTERAEYHRKLAEGLARARAMRKQRDQGNVASD